jgi:hypothetical protein
MPPDWAMLRGCERLRAAEEEELAEGAAGTVLYAVATFRYRSDIAAEFSSSRATADQQLAINQSHCNLTRYVVSVVTT